ncbi:MAG TPA: hypothetical protein VKE42_01985 [Candidatus Cybelea sp.]|nr:hypothetical protein [Candidatus Cybelea sp.]
MERDGRVVCALRRHPDRRRETAMRREKFIFAMTRVSIFAGVATLMFALPSVVLSAPTGGAVFHAAPVIVRPAFPQRSAEQNRNNFTVPFHINAAPKAAAPDTLRLPTPQWYARHAWTWQPNYVYFANPFAGSCFGNTGNWAAPPQNAAASQSTLNDVTIGSLAGDPKHSVLSKSAADIAAALTSSNTSSESSSSPVGLQIQFQPSICPSTFGI